MQDNEENGENSNEASYNLTGTHDVSAGRIKEQITERRGAGLHISITQRDQEDQLRQILTQIVKSPTDLPKVPLDTLFKEGCDGAIQPPTIYSCQLSPQKHSEKVSEAGQESLRSKTATDSRNYDSMDRRSKISTKRVSNVVKMLQGPRPIPRRKSAGGNQKDQHDESSEEEGFDVLQLTKKKQPIVGRYPEIKRYRKLKQRILELQEANKSNVQNLQSHKTDLQKRGIVSKEFKAPEYGQSRNSKMELGNANSQKQEKKVVFPSIDKQRVHPPRKHLSSQVKFGSSNVDNSQQKDMGPTVSPELEKKNSTEMINRHVLANDHKKWSQQINDSVKQPTRPQEVSKTDQNQQEAKANLQNQKQSSTSIIKNQSQMNIHSKSNKSKVLESMRKSQSNVQIREQVDDYASAASRYYDLSLSNTLNQVIHLKDINKQVRKKLSSKLDVQAANRALSSSPTDLTQLYYQEKKVTTKNSRSRIASSRRQQNDERSRKKKVSRSLRKNARTTQQQNESKINLHSSMKQSYLSSMAKGDIRYNIITSELIRNSSRVFQPKEMQKGNVSPWAPAERSIDHSTEILRTGSSKQGSQDGAPDNSVDQKFDDQVKILNTNQNQSSNSKLQMNQRSRNPNLRIASQPQSKVNHGPDESEYRYKSVPDGKLQEMIQQRNPQIQMNIQESGLPQVNDNQKNGSSKFNNDISHVSRVYDFAKSPQVFDEKKLRKQLLRQSQRTEMQSAKKPVHLEPLNRKSVDNPPRWRPRYRTHINSSQQVSPDDSEARKWRLDDEMNTKGVQSALASQVHQISYTSPGEEADLIDEAVITKLKFYSQIKAQQLSDLKRDQRNMQILKKQAKKAEQQRINYQQVTQRSFDINFAKQVYNKDNALNMRQTFIPNSFLNMSQYQSNFSSTFGSAVFSHQRDSESKKQGMSRTGLSQTNYLASIKKDIAQQSKLDKANEILETNIPEIITKKKFKRQRRQPDREAINSSEMTHISATSRFPQTQSGRVSAKKQPIFQQYQRDESKTALQSIAVKTNGSVHLSPQAPMQYLKENMDLLQHWKGGKSFEESRKSRVNKKQKKNTLAKVIHPLQFDLSMPKEGGVKAVKFEQQLTEGQRLHDPVQHYHGMGKDKALRSSAPVNKSASKKKVI